MNQVIENIKTRRSVRKFKDKNIPHKLILQIIEAGRYAPSSHNSQPWRFIVVENKEMIEKCSKRIKSYFKTFVNIGRFVSRFTKRFDKELRSGESRVFNEKDLIFYDAPLVIFICSKKSKFSVKDCSLAAENMMLAAHSLGIGSCWIGFADYAFRKDNIIKNELGIPAKHDIVGTIAFGYSAASSKWKVERKEEAGVVNWLK